MKSTLFRSFIIVGILVFLLGALITQGGYLGSAEESSEDPSIVYSYDALGRLIKVEYSTGTTITYRYDAAGNMLTREISKIGPPLVTNPTSSQVIPDDTDNDPQWGEIATLNVTVTDDTEVASVTVNLSAVGGSAIQPMSNIVGDIWSVTTNASAGTLPQTYYLQVNATDIYGNSNTSVSIPLTVLRNGDVSGNGVVNIADAMLLANNVSYPYHDPPYVISSPYVADVSGNGVLNIADAMLIANHVSYPYHEPPYKLR